eukprot:GILK01008396.1.p1 GENE.GILK01008396.1~~GILK01008396.1.p1  ORF type:complete len:303 (-),score=31.06 GILK01008396.1:279-1139(-)
MAAVEEEFQHEFPSSPPVTKEQKLALLIESMKSGGQFDAVVDMCQDILNSFRENEQRFSAYHGDGSRSLSPGRPRPRSAVTDEKGHVKQAVGVIVDTVWRNNVARPSSSPAFSKTRTERNFTTSAAVVADLIQKFGTANPHEAYTSNDGSFFHTADDPSDSHSILWPSAQTLMNTHIEGRPYHTQQHTQARTHAHTHANTHTQAQDCRRLKLYWKPKSLVFIYLHLQRMCQCIPGYHQLPLDQSKSLLDCIRHHLPILISIKLIIIITIRHRIVVLYILIIARIQT